jgi:hypothetical protein
MLKINRTERTFSHLQPQKMKEIELKERSDLQAMIRNSPRAFFKEMGEEMLLLAEELKPAEFVDDRIDLLALDRSGAVVVIELKRGKDRLQLLQALAYASMVAEWNSDELLKRRAEIENRQFEDIRDEVEEFLETDLENLNEIQRLILIAEAYDYEVLTTAKWLSERYGIDIRCYRVILASDEGNELLTCTCIFPPAEISQHAIIRKNPDGKVIRSVKWTNWDEALKLVKNEAVVKFFQDELTRKQENYLLKRSLRYRHDGKRRWNASAKANHVYLWQVGRFDNDIGFWQQRLGDQADVETVKDGVCLRFYLRSEKELLAFKKAISQELQNVVFNEALDLPDADGETEN